MVRSTSTEALPRTGTGARLVPGVPSGQMLRVSFRSLIGTSPTVVLASCLKFCVDGTLRGSDNCIVAQSSDGFWRVGGKLHRELDCDGPVRIRMVVPGRAAPFGYGPF